MKSCLLVGGTLLAASVACAENLVVGGDFTEAKKDLAPLVRTNGGRAALYTENATWNRCGRLEISGTTTNAEGYVIWNAMAVVGSDGKGDGVPVKPGRTYDFSVEVRGDRDGLGAAIDAQAWGAGGFWKARRMKALGGVVLKKSWTLFKGSFKAPEGTDRAGIILQLWASSRYQPVRLAVGDCLYFDNLRIEEAAENLETFTASAGKKAEKVPRVKAVASGTSFGDFLLYARGTGAQKPAPVSPEVRVDAGDGHVLVSLSVRDPKGVVAGNAKSPWSGEAVEIFFGPVADNVDRGYTQLAFNPAGAKFARGAGALPPEAWEIVESRVDGNVWTARVRVPYETLGWKRQPQKGETIAFNVAVQLLGSKSELSWAPVATGFQDVQKFGRLIVGSYADALKLRYGCADGGGTRDSYEEKVSDLETAEKQAELDRFKDAGFTVSVVPIDSDFSVPFVPREAFHPVKEIAVKAAVNERVGVPVAILNLTDRAEEYVVRLETSTFDPDPNKAYADKQFNGEWGLEGFPKGQFVAREALRMKDTDHEPVTLRLEQLPKMNEACTIQVPPKESGIVFLDFDTADVKPETYRGRLRVIPLGSASKWQPFRGVSYHNRTYVGKMQDIPFALEVRPIVLSKKPAMPSAFFQHAGSEGMFELMHGLGVSDFAIDAWSFQWARTADGAHLDLSKPRPPVATNERDVKNTLAWSKARGIHPTFFIGYGAFFSFCGTCGFKKDHNEAALRLWPEYLRGVKACMNAWGVPDSDYMVEVYDEPHEVGFDNIYKTVASGKAGAPSVNLLLTIGARALTPDQMRKLDPYVDGWVLWTPDFGREGHCEFMAEAMAAGRKIWHYTCNTSGRVPIYETYRLHPWFGYRYKLTGNQFYFFQEQTGGYGPADFKTAMSSGIVYRSFESTMPGLRYMSMRRGVEDLKYLEKLRAVAGNRPEVRKFLEDAPVRVTGTERHDKTTADRMREQAADLILRYQASGAAE